MHAGKRMPLPGQDNTHVTSEHRKSSALVLMLPTATQDERYKICRVMMPRQRFADMIAEKWAVSREDMEEFAVTSHERALKAQAEGRFDNEIVPVGEVARDEGPREPNWEKIRSLPTLQEGGRITAADLWLAYEAGAFPGSPVGAGANTGLAPYAIEHLLVVGYDVLAIAYLVRYAILIVLAITAPLAGLFFLLPETHHLSKMWASHFTTNLFMQPAQLFVLTIGFALERGGSSTFHHLFALATLLIVFKVQGAMGGAEKAAHKLQSSVESAFHHIEHALVKA